MTTDEVRRDGHTSGGVRGREGRREGEGGRRRTSGLAWSASTSRRGRAATKVVVVGGIIPASKEKGARDYVKGETCRECGRCESGRFGLVTGEKAGVERRVACFAQAFSSLPPPRVCCGLMGGEGRPLGCARVWVR